MVRKMSVARCGNDQRFFFFCSYSDTGRGNDHWPIKKSKQKYKRSHADAYTYTAGILKNFETVRVYEVENILVDDITKQLCSFTNSINSETREYSLGVTLTEIILSSTMVLSAIFLALWKNYRGDQIFYLATFSFQQSQNLSNFIEAFYRIFQAGDTFKKIDRYLSISPRKQPKSKLSAVPSLITFNGVKCSRFENLTFTIHRGDKILLCGPTRCGKSSLLKLLAATTAPIGGNIIVTSNVKLKLQNVSNLRDYITYIPSEPGIFPTSLINNIQIADISLFKNREGENPGISERVLSAARAVGLDDEIAKAAVLYEDKADIQNLSWRQKKKISLARLFLKLTPIILLDNPLTGLDFPKIFLDSLYNAISDQRSSLGPDNKSAYPSTQDYTMLIVEDREEFMNHAIYKLFNKIIRFEESGHIRLFACEDLPIDKEEEKEKYIGRWTKHTKIF